MNNDQVLVLRQGEPVVVLREREKPLIVENQTSDTIRLDRFGTTIIQNFDEPPITDLLVHYRLASN